MTTRLLSYAKKSAVTFVVTTTTPSTRSYYPSRTAVQIPDPPLLSRVCPSGTSPPGQVQCVCGDEASGKSTVECASCSSWSHIQCARLTLRTAKQSRFLCHKCRPATGKRAGAAGGKKGQGDTAHLLAPPRPSLQSSSNELPAPATSPPTCSPMPAQYSPLLPHQHSPPPPSQPPSAEHSQPTSSPSSNPPNPPWKHPPIRQYDDIGPTTRPKLLSFFADQQKFALLQLDGGLGGTICEGHLLPRRRWATGT